MTEDAVSVDETEEFTPPDFGEDGRLRVGTEEADDIEHEDGEGESEAAPVTTLTDEERAQFRTLMGVGKRTKKFSLFDHTVVIRSLMCDDELRIGLMTERHKSSTGFSRAYQCATVAAAIVSIGNDNWNNSLAAEPDPDELFTRKYRKVLDLHPMVVQYIYDKVQELESEFAELLTKLGKL